MRYFGTKDIRERFALQETARPYNPTHRNGTKAGFMNNCENVKPNTQHLRQKEK